MNMKKDGSISVFLLLIFCMLRESFFNDDFLNPMIFHTDHMKDIIPAFQSKTRTVLRNAAKQV